MSQYLQMKAMEQANYEEQQVRKEQLRDCYDTLRKQAAEHEQMKKASREERMGKISSEFFENFGRSCR